MNAPKVTKRVRKRFTRVITQIEGHPVKFELRANGIHARKAHSRKLHVLSFADLYAVALGQSLMKL